MLNFLIWKVVQVATLWHACAHLHFQHIQDLSLPSPMSQMNMQHLASAQWAVPSTLVDLLQCNSHNSSSHGYAHAHVDRLSVG